MIAKAAYWPGFILYGDTQSYGNASTVPSAPDSRIVPISFSVVVGWHDFYKTNNDYF